MFAIKYERLRGGRPNKGPPKLPATLEVSAVCTVGGEVGRAATAIGRAGWAGLEDCTGLAPGLWTKPGLLIGVKPVAAGEGVTAEGNSCAGADPAGSAPTP